jgi:hypothetical protein
MPRGATGRFTGILLKSSASLDNPVASVPRALLLPIIGVLGLCVGSIAAWADHEPVLVVPTRPDVPVIINGVDVSWCVVEGDWGLYRPAAVPLTVTCPRFIGPSRAPARGDYTPDYYPRTGHQPPVGRLEVVPPAYRALPPPAPSFYRLWTTPPDQAPVTEYAPYNGPPVVVAPRTPFHLQ